MAVRRTARWPSFFPRVHHVRIITCGSQLSIETRCVESAHRSGRGRRDRAGRCPPRQASTRRPVTSRGGGRSRRRVRMSGGRSSRSRRDRRRRRPRPRSARRRASAPGCSPDLASRAARRTPPRRRRRSRRQANSSRCLPWSVQSRRKGGRSPGAATARRRALPAPYVGHGSAAFFGAGLRGRAAVVVGAGGRCVDVARGRLLPQETRAPATAISPRAARLRRVTEP